MPESMLDGVVPSFNDDLEERRKLMALKVQSWFESLQSSAAANAHVDRAPPLVGGVGAFAAAVYSPTSAKKLDLRAWSRRTCASNSVCEVRGASDPACCAIACNRAQ